MSMTVKETAAGRWQVLDGDQMLAEFATNGEAWRWLDKHERRELWAHRESADWTGRGVYYGAPLRSGKKA